MTMKRFLSLLLTSSLLLGCCALGGCGEQKKAAPADNAPTSTNTTAENNTVKNPKVLDGAKLVVFGDSLTAFGKWPLATAEATNMYVFNGAMGGINTTEALDRFDKYVAQQHPDFVTLCFGQNDLLMEGVDQPQVTPEQFKENLKTMCEQVVALDATPILMTCSYMNESIWWSSQAQNRQHYVNVGTPTEWLDQYCNAVRELAAEGGYDLVDIREACDNYAPSDFLTNDGVHLGDTGNTVFAEKLADYLLSHYTSDPNAEKILNRYPHIAVPAEPAVTDIISYDATKWEYDPDVLTVETNDGGALVMYNTDGRWPDAQYYPFESVYAPYEGTELVYDFSADFGVNTSILLFFNGASPTSYNTDNYMSINRFLGVKLNGEDIMGGQDCVGSISLKDLDLPAEAIDEHGNVLISGVKVFAAGVPYLEVTVRQLALSTTGAPNA